MKTFFRTDSSFSIGSGHVTRCLTLAKALRKKGHDCRFICRQHLGSLAEQIVSAGFGVDLLPLSRTSSLLPKSLVNPSNEYEHWLGVPWDEDALETSSILKKLHVDWLIVDHYGIDHKWEGHLRPFCGRIMVIDDLANRRHNCDFLLDQNLVHEYKKRYTNLVSENCICILGPEYALLQSEYSQFHPRTPPRVGSASRVLVYYGGADQHNITGKTVSAFLSLGRTDVDLDVVVSCKNPNYAAIRDLALQSRRIALHESVPSLAELMIRADISFGATGATTWERCCLGLPTYVVTLAANQEPIAKELNKLGIVQWLGDQKDITEDLLQSKLCTALGPTASYTEWSIRCQNLLDGQGTDRVIDIMELDKESLLCVRLAKTEDEELILQWANDPLVRSKALAPGIITPEVHRQWFYKRLRNPSSCKLYIVSTRNGLPIGQVRLEQVKDMWEVHYALASIARGRGLGKSIINMVLQEFSQIRNNTTIFGRVKVDNIPSQKTLLKCGFELRSEQNGELLFLRHI